MKLRTAPGDESPFERAQPNRDRDGCYEMAGRGEGWRGCKALGEVAIIADSARQAMGAFNCSLRLHRREAARTRARQNTTEMDSQEIRTKAMAQKGSKVCACIN